MKVEQWEISESINLEGQTLQLIGAGVRSVLFMKPYVLAFYATESYQDYPDVIASEKPKSMQLIINSDMINSALIVMGLKEGLGRTTYGQLPELKPKFEHVFGLLEQLKIKKGDKIDLFANEQNEIVVYLNGEEQIKEADTKVIKAIFGIWFSKEFDKKLRNSLLGK
ncbi:MAG: chalcone isomerase family protein [Chitinophagales bacterium]